MSAPITLRGMTWAHPRGFDPMIGCSRIWRAQTGVQIDWEQRSLQDFESYPVADLARRYDLIVIDHPHVGQITAEGCLLPLDGPAHAAEQAAIAAGSVGASYASYTWEGRQWAFPIDAATQVQAYRPDLLDAPARTFSDVLALAAEGLVMIPLRPPHSLMAFITLAAHAGHPCRTERGVFVDRATGLAVLRWLKDLAACVDPACFGMDPIAVFEAMAEENARTACAPLIYGYVSYAAEGFRARRLAFADMPVEPGRPPVGSALGGTGIAVSAMTEHPREAVAFAHWIASGAIQRGAYAASGGQPGHAEAWEDEAVNVRTGNFYRATRATLEGAILRPRHAGYMAFQHEAADLVNAALRADRDETSLLDAIDTAFMRSFAG